MVTSDEHIFNLRYEDFLASGNLHERLIVNLTPEIHGNPKEILDGNEYAC